MKKNLGNTPVLAPLPVLIVATYDEQGMPNAMNVAWGGQCGYHHVALNLSLNYKTTENLKHTKAFTLSIATVDTLVVSDYFGLVSGRKENKIEKAGVHVTRSEFVDAPVIDEYPLTLECKVIEMQEALGEMHVVGEVVNMQADESILDEQGKVDLGKLRSISYDSASHSYRVLGDIVGKAFKDGNKLL
jgi:flavin reductase (DIM6/NTAB) family NADH-FMN oxidoreductase RutF